MAAAKCEALSSEAGPGRAEEVLRYSHPCKALLISPLCVLLAPAQCTALASSAVKAQQPPHAAPWTACAFSWHATRACAGMTQHDKIERRHKWSPFAYSSNEQQQGKVQKLGEA